MLCIHTENTEAILNAVDGNSLPFIDILIQSKQKMVISEFLVQEYLQVMFKFINANFYSIFLSIFIFISTLLQLL